jgi:hypothetical protein
VFQWSDPAVMSHLLTRLPVLFTSLGIWVFYLGAELLPKLHREYEREELERFRAELVDPGEEEGAARSRLELRSKSLLPPRPRSQR